jgi:hypothetical protein
MCLPPQWAVDRPAPSSAAAAAAAEHRHSRRQQAPSLPPQGTIPHGRKASAHLVPDWPRSRTEGGRSRTYGPLCHAQGCAHCSHQKQVQVQAQARDAKNCISQSPWPASSLRISRWWPRARSPRFYHEAQCTGIRRPVSNLLLQRPGNSLALRDPGSRSVGKLETTGGGGAEIKLPISHSVFEMSVPRLLKIPDQSTRTHEFRRRCVLKQTEQVMEGARGLLERDQQDVASL